MPRKIITENLKQEIIEYYLSQPMSLKAVETKFKLSAPTVIKILKDIPKYPKAKIKNPSLKENFFKEIDSEEKSYFLGLLISDGNVFKDSTGRQASISITLENQDKYLLEIFKEKIQANTSISQDGRGCSQFAFRSNLIAKDLEQYGVIPRKSYDTFLPVIKEEHMASLIRGIFDGDGSILVKENGDRFLHSISFCGSRRLMEELSNYLFDNLFLKQKPTVYHYKDKELSEIKIQNIQDIYCFGKWIYRDAKIFMKRKEEKFQKFCNHYKLKYGNTELTN